MTIKKTIKKTTKKARKIAAKIADIETGGLVSFITKNGKKIKFKAKRK